MASRRGISLKAAWAAVKRGTGGRMAKRKRSGRKRSGRRSGYARSTYRRAKGILSGAKVPLTLTYIVGGGAVDVFNLAPDIRKRIFAGLNGITKPYGITLDGYTLGGYLVLLRGACSLSPWLHDKVNGFLSGFGMKI